MNYEVHVYNISKRLCTRYPLWKKFAWKIRCSMFINNAVALAIERNEQTAYGYTEKINKY